MRLIGHRFATKGAIAAGLLVLSVLMAQCEANPYGSITERNVFKLKDPPVPAPPPPAPATPRPSPKLVLTGVVDFSSMRWAFITRTDPGQPPKNYTLSFGENEGGLRLVGIDAGTASATLLVDGSETVTLRLADRSSQPAPAAPRTQFSAVPKRVFTRGR